MRRASKRRNGGLVLLLWWAVLVKEVASFVVTKRQYQHHRHVDVDAGTRLSTEVTYTRPGGLLEAVPTMVDHLYKPRTHAVGFPALHVAHARRNKNHSGERSTQRSSSRLARGMATQLGGWSYARTVFSSESKNEEKTGSNEGEGHDSVAASEPSDSKGQSRACDTSAAGGSITGSSKAAAGGTNLGTGGEGADDDDDDDDKEGKEDGNISDSRGAEGEKKPPVPVAVGSQAGSSPPEGYEVVCDGDVCEMKPKATTSLPLDDDSAATGPEVDSAQGVVDDDGQHRPTTSPSAIEEEAGDAAVADGGEDSAADLEEVQEESPLPLDPDVEQLVSMGWDAEESTLALQETNGDVLAAAEALAEKEEADLERFQEGLSMLRSKGWDEDVAMSAMREAQGNSTQALEALQEEDRMLSMQFEQSIAEMVEHGWDEEVARKALLMQWQKDIENRGGGRKAQKQFEKTVKDVQAKGAGGGDGSGASTGGKAKSAAQEPPAPTPAKREDVVFDVTDKNLQKVVLESPVPVILDLYAEWCGPCKQLTPALEEAAIRSGGMFRLAKIDAEKQRSVAEILGIAAFPSIFGMKDGILLDNFVGILPQDEMQSFMMGVIMGRPQAKDKVLREHQKGASELRGLSRKLAHVAGLAALGSRKKETLCLKVDKALSEMLPPMEDGQIFADKAAVAKAKKAARTAISVLMSAYKFPEDPKYRSLSTSSKVYTEVLSAHPPMVEVLRLAGFRHKNGDETHLTLMHRNMAVLSSVQDRVEVWNKATKMPVEEEDEEDEYDTSEEEEDEETRLARAANKAHLASVAKLQITPSKGGGKVVRIEMAAQATLGELFAALKENEGFGDDLVLTTTFPKRELAAADTGCHSNTLLALGLAPSARLVATDSATLAEEKEGNHEEADEKAARKEALRTKMMEKAKDMKGKGTKHGGSLFGAEDGIIEVQKGKNVHYFGGDSTVTLAAEEEEDAGEQDTEESADDDFGEDGIGEEVNASSQESELERDAEAPAVAALARRAELESYEDSYDSSEEQGGSISPGEQEHDSDEDEGKLTPYSDEDEESLSESDHLTDDGDDSDAEVIGSYDEDDYDDDGRGRGESFGARVGKVEVNDESYDSSEEQWESDSQEYDSDSEKGQEGELTPYSYEEDTSVDESEDLTEYDDDNDDEGEGEGKGVDHEYRKKETGKKQSHKRDGR